MTRKGVRHNSLYRESIGAALVLRLPGLAGIGKIDRAVSYSDMARVLGISEETVSSRLDRTRHLLRAMLDEHDRRETKKKVSADERRHMLEMLKVVRDAFAVARAFGRNPNMTWRIARQAGIELTAGYAKRGYPKATEQ